MTSSPAVARPQSEFNVQGLEVKEEARTVVKGHSRGRTSTDPKPLVLLVRRSSLCGADRGIRFSTKGSCTAAAHMSRRVSPCNSWPRPVTTHLMADPCSCSDEQLLAWPRGCVRQQACVLRAVAACRSGRMIPNGAANSLLLGRTLGTGTAFAAQRTPLKPPGVPQGEPGIPVSPHMPCSAHHVSTLGRTAAAPLFASQRL